MPQLDPLNAEFEKVLGNADDVKTQRTYFEWSGELTPQQRLTLDLFPRVALPQVRRSETHVDLDAKLIRVVILNTRGKPPADEAQRLGYIDQGFKMLLGPVWTVEVVRRNRHLFRTGERVIFRAGPLAKSSWGEVYRPQVATPDPPNSWRDRLRV